MLALLLVAASFAAPVQYAAPAHQAVIVRDVDGDGWPDIITSGNQLDEAPALSLLLNRGYGSFAPASSIATNFGETLQDAAGLDGDGRPELLTSVYWENGIATYRGGAFERHSYGTATHGGPSRFLDYDGDGVRDIVSLSFGSGNPVRVHLFRGRGDGTFEEKITADTNLANGASLSTRTINGALELLVSERSGNLGVIRIGGGAVSVRRLPVDTGFDVACTFADVNGDGVADVIDSDDSQSPLEPVFVRLARADGTFEARRQVTQPRHATFPVALRAADLDGDGRMDVVVLDIQASHVLWLRGRGDGTFDEAVPIDAGAPVNDVAIADVNRDGRADLVTVNANGTVSVILNCGTCTRRRAVRP